METYTSSLIEEARARMEASDKIIKPESMYVIDFNDTNDFDRKTVLEFVHDMKQFYKDNPYRRVKVVLVDNKDFLYKLYGESFDFFPTPKEWLDNLDDGIHLGLNI
jgi:hypothetical protein